MENERKLDEFVNREVYYNVSHIVTELINRDGSDWWEITSQLIEDDEGDLRWYSIVVSQAYFDK